MSKSTSSQLSTPSCTSDVYTAGRKKKKKEKKKKKKKRRKKKEEKEQKKQEDSFYLRFLLLSLANMSTSCFLVYAKQEAVTDN